MLNPMTISLENILPPERVILLESSTKDDALKELAGVVARASEVDNVDLLVPRTIALRCRFAGCAESSPK